MDDERDVGITISTGEMADLLGISVREFVNRVLAMAAQPRELWVAAGKDPKVWDQAVMMSKHYKARTN